MSEQILSYRVIRGAIKMPRTAKGNFSAKHNDFIVQGQLLPTNVFPDDDIESWLEGGRIERADVTVAVIEEAERVRSANPFRADPTILVGKTMEELVIMILEIQDDYDTDKLTSEQDAVRLLTSGWTPSQRQIIAPVNDRSRPEVIAMHNMEQKRGEGSVIGSSNAEMSAAAQAGLEAARAKAQAPESEE